MTEIQPCPHGHTPGTCRACLHAENERLKTALATANANHERFEREWYLRGDEIERLQADLQKALANHTADLSVPDPSSTEVESLRRENVRWENAHKIVLADNERLKRQVDELSTHAEKWVKRALARAEDGSGPCDLVQQMRLAGYHDWATAVERLQRPWHEREAPHCSTCACSPYQAPEPAADLLADAERIVADYARRNPKWADANGVVQDPWGAHGWLDRYRAAQTSADGFSAIADALSKADPANYRPAQPPGDDHAG